MRPSYFYNIDVIEKKEGEKEETFYNIKRSEEIGSH